MHFSKAALLSLLCVASTLPSGTVVAADSSLSDLPWGELSSRLTPSASLFSVSPQTAIEECVPTFAEWGGDITMYDLEASGKSGVCMHSHACVYQDCSPIRSDNEFDDYDKKSGYCFDFILESKITDIFYDPANTRFNLPVKVLQPTSVGDIVAAVEFAAEHNVEISVKNSGHNWNGASMKKDTILIHTPSLPSYSASSFQDCGIVSGSDEVLGVDEIDDTLSNQPCELAKARKVAGVMRVGGGENFNAFYKSVKAVNEIALSESGSYKYHPIGGAAGTVTPMGWTWQGGLPGTQMGRTLGFGVDQVLQLEMVLPDGSHVRFGPTEWEEAEGYRYPKTTKVSGVCNENPFAEDESDYAWGPCTNEVNFEDLWFAVRGGGGGTWGVVVSTHLQLHDYPGLLQPVFFDYAMGSTLSGCNATELDCEIYRSELVSVLAEFSFDFFVTPERITGITPEFAARCGCPNGDSVYVCFSNDDVLEIMKFAWATRLQEQTPNLTSVGVPEEMIAIAGQLVFSGGPKADYVEQVPFPEDHRHFGNAQENPKPGMLYQIQLGTANMLIPKSVVLENRDYFIEKAYRDAHETSKLTLPYQAFPALEDTDDQMSSLSQPHREAAFMFMHVPDLFTGRPNEDIPKQLEMLFGGLDFDGDFPGVFGSNHAHVRLYGPLKSDWTKPCSFETYEEIEELCFSQQEAIFGTSRLARLEQIKADIDPMNLFNCQLCVQPAVTDSEDTDGGSGAAMFGVLAATRLLGVVFVSTVLIL